MGTLKPNANYIYERANGVVYAREQGTNERTAIGWHYTKDPNAEWALWSAIFIAAEDDPALQAAIDHVKMLYKSKQIE